jgi:hypothetical protein
VTAEGQNERPRPRSRSVAKRLRALPPELRNAGIAAACLVASMLLPWYVKNYAVAVDHRVQATHDNLRAFGVFTWVEAAVLLVAGGVLVLIWARANEKAFHLPGGDGTVIFGAGCWAVLLLTWRLFDKPGSSDPSVSYGLQWGFVGAFIAAGALAAAGARVRTLDRPEPPNPAADEPDWQTPPRRRRENSRSRRPRDASAVTEVLRERPAWSGEPPRRPPVPEPDPSEADTRVDRSEADTRVDRSGADRRVDRSEADTRVQRDDPPHDRLF